MSETPNLNPNETNQELQNTTDSASEYPVFDKEKAQQLRDEYNNGSSNDGETAKDRERLMLNQQLDDMSVLLGLCDEKGAMDILHSDAYGILLENQVSLADLFNADALFNERYFSDGYTYDGWRYDYDGFLGDYDSETKLGRKKNERQWNIKQELHMQGYADGKGERRSQNANPDLEADKNRTQDAKETIQTIVEEYFSDYSDEEETAEFKNILHLRANNEELSDEQKDFLKHQWNPAAERLLYNGHIINEERASNILEGLEYGVERYNNSKKEDEERGWGGDTTAGTLVSNMFYAEGAISDFEEAGRPDLVDEAKQKLSEMVDEYLELIVNTDTIAMSDDLKMSRFDHMDRLIFGYSDPYKLVDRVKKYDLCNREYDWLSHDQYFIREPNRIVQCITENYHPYDNDVYLSYEAKDLKQFGVDDDAILEHCNSLHPVDFINAETIDGTGARFLEAGIDRQKVLDKIFSSRGWNNNPFEKQNYPFEGESYFDVLERNGFSATEIAQTFSPDAISENLAEFLERGADAKELVEYMFSYHEEFEGNRMLNKNGETVGYYRMWFEGIQDMTVWDKNHPEGRTVGKIGMPYRGVDYVAANLDLLAENGITEDDIFNTMPDSYASPNDSIIPEMVKCNKFNTNKVLRKGYEKEKKYLEARLESGDFGEDYVKVALDPILYASDVFHKINSNNEFEYNPVRDIKQAMAERGPEEQ